MYGRSDAFIIGPYSVKSSGTVAVSLSVFRTNLSQRTVNIGELDLVEMFFLHSIVIFELVFTF